MMPKAFSLKPFPAAGLPPGIVITGYAARSEEKLSVRYELRGPLTQLLIPAPADMPARLGKLWEETCFEFFLGPKNSDRYWEFNLSASLPALPVISMPGGRPAAGKGTKEKLVRLISSP